MARRYHLLRLVVQVAYDGFDHLFLHEERPAEVHPVLADLLLQQRILRVARLTRGAHLEAEVDVPLQEILIGLE